jgi:hypothetical protein
MPSDVFPVAEDPTPSGPGVLPSYSEDGVDLTLIRWMLGMTPDERLQVLQDAVNSILDMRDAKRDL